MAFLADGTPGSPGMLKRPWQIDHARTERLTEKSYGTSLEPNEPSKRSKKPLSA